MIDPVISLAYSIHANPGVYALLIGSGVSRSAAIPTGWEIVLDLAAKLATLHNEDSGADPAAWYRQKYGAEPEYSALLDGLAKSPEERQQLLASFFEPTEDEREDGLKAPTAAHRSIAKLVVTGHVRVILTTNFDRLIERAIEDEGVTPVVLSTPDAIEGALPLVHQRCCIFKLHGDYLDTRIKNTASELDEYDSRVNRLLDRVLDEFGVVICGWSAQWDASLRSAFDRCSSRRFTTYYATRGEPSPQAKRLLDARRGVSIPIGDADSFFADVQEKVAALDDLRQAHPLSVAAAGATMKRLLADEKHIIRLHDLVTQETEKAFQSLQPPLARLLGGGDQKQKFAAAIAEFQSNTEILRAICACGAFWGRPNQLRALAQIPGRLASDPNAGQSGVRVSESLRAIPSVVTLYTMGIAALASDNFPALAATLSTPSLVVSGQRRPYLSSIDWSAVDHCFKLLEAHKQHLFPASEWLFIDCRRFFRELIPDDSEFERLFDLFEVIRTFVYIDQRYPTKTGENQHRVWGPGGRFVWKSVRRGDDEDILGQISMDDKVMNGLCSAGLFGGDAKVLSWVIDQFRPTFQQMVQRCW